MRDALRLAGHKRTNRTERGVSVVRAAAAVQFPTAIER
jgi:hypothetical protein